MKIKAIELRNDGFMTEGFAFGGEEGYLSFDYLLKMLLLKKLVVTIYVKYVDLCMT